MQCSVLLIKIILFLKGVPNIPLVATYGEDHTDDFWINAYQSTTENKALYYCSITGCTDTDQNKPILDYPRKGWIRMINEESVPNGRGYVKFKRLAGGNEWDFDAGFAKGNEEKSFICVTAAKTVPNPGETNFIVLLINYLESVAKDTFTCLNLF